MPIYEFYDLKSGKVVERFYNRTEVPSIGTRINADGQQLVRIIQAKSYQSNSSKTGVFSSVQIPRGHPAIDAAGLKRDKHGRACFDGMSDVRKFERESERAHELDPRLPVYKHGALADSTQSDKDSNQAMQMRELKLRRQVKEACRGIAGIDVDKAFKED